MQAVLEVILVPVEDGRLRCQAVHDASDPESPWVILVAPADRELDYWLLWIETESLTDFRLVDFSPDAADAMTRMAVLLGDSWGDLWDDWNAMIETQRQCLDLAAEAFLKQARAQPFDELVDWRRAMDAEPPQTGELMREQMLGIKPLQGRN